MLQFKQNWMHVEILNVEVLCSMWNRLFVRNCCLRRTLRIGGNDAIGQIQSDYWSWNRQIISEKHLKDYAC